MMAALSRLRLKLLAAMVHDRAVPGESTLIQRVSRGRTHENYRFAAPPVAGRKVLDIGPGYGIGYPHLLAGDPASITCMDAFEQALDGFAVDDPRIEHVTGDFLRNAFPDRSFDVVLCFAAMYYLRDHVRLLSQIDRVLAPGGVLLINTFDADLLTAHNWSGPVPRTSATARA